MQPSLVRMLVEMSFSREPHVQNDSNVAHYIRRGSCFTDASLGLYPVLSSMTSLSSVI